MSRKLIYAGATFGSWTVVEYRPKFSPCRCACGRTEKLCRNAALVNGTTTACKECGLEKCHKAHTGMKTRRILKNVPDEVYRRLFTIVTNAIARCTNREYIQWKDYGGRGITIYPPWLEDKWKFIEYLAELPGHSDPELVLGRENNNGNYEPGNLRFVTCSTSNYNRRPFNPNHSRHKA